MTKLYYTCPIQAAYMAKEFGVRYTDEGRLFTNLESIGMYLDYNVLKEGVRYEVSADSLHIFEPQVGDVCMMWSDDGNSFAPRVCVGEGVELDGVEKIIQRNNKPFMWPLSEESE